MADDESRFDGEDESNLGVLGPKRRPEHQTGVSLSTRTYLHWYIGREVVFNCSWIVNVPCEAPVSLLIMTAWIHRA